MLAGKVALFFHELQDAQVWWHHFGDLVHACFDVLYITHELEIVFGKNEKRTDKLVVIMRNDAQLEFRNDTRETS